MAEQVIVTVVGLNRPGVLAEVTGKIARFHGNIMDIGQMMVQNYFHLFMIVEIDPRRLAFKTFKEGIEKLGEEKGYKVSVQHSKVFLYMHRI